MTELKTKGDLLAALQRSAREAPSAEMLHRQRVSFVMASMKDDSTVTREAVDREVRRWEGHDAA